MIIMDTRTLDEIATVARMRAIRSLVAKRGPMSRIQRLAAHPGVQARFGDEIKQLLADAKQAHAKRPNQLALAGH